MRCDSPRPHRAGRRTDESTHANQLHRTWYPILYPHPSRRHDELHARRVKERNARFAKETLRVHAEFASDLVSLRAARAAAERRERDLARAVGELRRAANERAIRKQLAEERERGHEGFGTPIPQVLVDINTTSRY